MPKGTAGTWSSIKGRDKGLWPSTKDNKKTLPRELVTPLSSFVYYVLSFVSLILVQHPQKVNAFRLQKICHFLEVSWLLFTLNPEPASHSRRFLHHFPIGPVQTPYPWMTYRHKVYNICGHSPGESLRLWIHLRRLRLPPDPILRP